MTLTAVALLLALVAPAQAASPVAVAPPTAPQPSADAQALAVLLNPEQPLVSASIHVFETGFREAIRQGAEGATVFEQYPGLDAAIVAGCKPVIEKHTRKSIPRLRDQAARFFADRFSPAELRQLRDFYASPTGTKLIAGMIAGMDGADAMPDYVRRDSGEISSKDISKMLGGSLGRMLPSLDDRDKAVLTSFARTPVYPKLQALQPEILALGARFANEPDPAFDADLEKVIEAVTTDFIAKHDAAKQTG